MPKPPQNDNNPGYEPHFRYKQCLILRNDVKMSLRQEMCTGSPCVHWGIRERGQDAAQIVAGGGAEKSGAQSGQRTDPL